MTILDKVALDAADTMLSMEALQAELMQAASLAAQLRARALGARTFGREDMAIVFSGAAEYLEGIALNMASRMKEPGGPLAFLRQMIDEMQETRRLEETLGHLPRPNAKA